MDTTKLMDSVLILRVCGDFYGTVVIYPKRLYDKMNFIPHVPK